MPNINVQLSAPGQTLTDDFLTININLDVTLADLKAYIHAETGLEPSRLRIFREGKALEGDTNTLEGAGIKDGDLLAAVVPPDSGSNPGPRDSATEAESMRQSLLQNPSALASQPPQIQQAVRSRDQFRAIYEQAKRRQMETASQDALYEADPFDADAQRRIEEEIRQQNVQANLDHAMNFSPESFASVTMLYINVKVNGTPIKAFVDSGAQTTIMSPSCAEACNIMRLIDKRFSGIARGVGTAKIIGKVHSADLNIANHFLPCSFTVMEGKSVDLLLGLDMMKQYQACIDLKQNKLMFSDFAVDFLPESEIPKHQEEERAAEETVPGPAGTTIGTETGTIRPAAESSKAPAKSSATVNDQKDSAAKQSSSQTAPKPGPNKEGVAQLVSLGFSEPEAIQALIACDGNVEAAAGLLFP